MFVVIDLQTGEVRERTSILSTAEKLADVLTETFAYINGHEFGVQLI